MASTPTNIEARHTCAAMVFRLGAEVSALIDAFNSIIGSPV
jgi:hypothetical protein|tara:strand:- start:210 stop:332 length:123 start_codon:yes stop_codon:yes gene_type:complete